MTFSSFKFLVKLMYMYKLLKGLTGQPPVVRGSVCKMDFLVSQHTTETFRVFAFSGWEGESHIKVTGILDGHFKY